MTGGVIRLSIPHIILVSIPSCSNWLRQIISDNEFFSRLLNELINSLNIILKITVIYNFNTFSIRLNTIARINGISIRELRNFISVRLQMIPGITFWLISFNAALSDLSYADFIHFRQYANTTPAQYVQSLRLTNAKMLLETTNYNITEIANLVGYENPLYFSRFFRKQCGMSPSQFRKQLVLNAENCPK